MITGPNQAFRTGHELSRTSPPSGPWVPKRLCPNRYPYPSQNHRCHKPVCGFSRHTVYSTGKGLKASSPLGWGRAGESRRERDRDEALAACLRPLGVGRDPAPALQRSRAALSPLAGSRQVSAFPDLHRAWTPHMAPPEGGVQSSPRGPPCS